MRTKITQTVQPVIAVIYLRSTLANNDDSVPALCKARWRSGAPVLVPKLESTLEDLS